MKKNIFTFWIDVYDVDVLVFIDMTKEEIAKEFKKGAVKPHAFEGAMKAIETWDLKDKVTRAQTAKVLGGHIALFKRKGQKGSELLGHINHETMHIVHALMRDKGMFLCDETEEAYAYLFQFISNMLIKNIVL